MCRGLSSDRPAISQIRAHILAVDVSDFAGGENSSFAIKPFHALPLFSTPFSLSPFGLPKSGLTR